MSDLLDRKIEKYIFKTAEETQKFGEKLGSSLKGGQVITAKARMGVGKTCLAQGIAKGLGVKRVVNSPTFNMIKVYNGYTLTFYHVDAYRLENASENKDIGLQDFLGNDDSVTYIEWPEYIQEELKYVNNIINIQINLLEDNSREVIVDYGNE